MKKTLVITVALLAAMTISAAAQPRNERAPREQKPATPEMMAEKMTERMASKLNLDEKQKSELYKLNLRNAKERRKDAENRRKESQEREKKAVKQRSKYDADLQKILTSEQYAEFKANREKNREKMMENHRGMMDKRGDKRDVKREGKPGDKREGMRGDKPGDKPEFKGERKHRSDSLRGEKGNN